MFIQFEGIENARDLGGLVRPDGSRLREGLLIRSGHLHHATDGDIERLKAMGLSLIVDFRDEREVVREPDREVPGARYEHRKVLADLRALLPPVDSVTTRRVRESFRDMYRYIATLPEAVDAYSAFFQGILAAEGKPVLWHCTQGKDRTGIGAILLLSALGFERETMIEEYLLTNRFAESQLEAMRLARASEEELTLMREVFPVFEENLRHWFDCIDIGYGSVANYLELALGVGPEEIARLEEYYIE